MVSRRGPRWMLWPAKLLWVPTALAGFWLTFVTHASMDDLGGGAFRVGLRFFEPAGWTDAPVLHGVGVVLLLAGVVLFWLYTWNPDPDRSAVIEEFPLWTLAAWAFLAVAVGASVRLTGQVWDVGGDGVAWRFLAEFRTHAVDRFVAVAAVLASVACAILSYGRSAYDRAWGTRSA